MLCVRWESIVRLQFTYKNNFGTGTLKTSHGHCGQLAWSALVQLWRKQMVDLEGLRREQMQHLKRIVCWYWHTSTYTKQQLYQTKTYISHQLISTIENITIHIVGFAVWPWFNNDVPYGVMMFMIQSDDCFCEIEYVHYIRVSMCCQVCVVLLIICICIWC